MSPNSVIKVFDIFKNKPVCMTVVIDCEAVQSLHFNQGMEGFYAGIIVWITAMRIAALHLFSSFSLCI